MEIKTTSPWSNSKGIKKGALFAYPLFPLLKTRGNRKERKAGGKKKRGFAPFL
jgi:hypothetical protein